MLISLFKNMIGEEERPALFKSKTVKKALTDLSSTLQKKGLLPRKAIIRHIEFNSDYACYYVTIDKNRTYRIPIKIIEKRRSHAKR